MMRVATGNHNATVCSTHATPSGHIGPIIRKYSNAMQSGPYIASEISNMRFGENLTSEMTF